MARLARRILIMKSQAALLLIALGSTHFAAHADLIRHWPFDGSFEELVEGDDGSGVGTPAFAEDRGSAPGKAISFDGGSQQYVEVPGGGGLDGLNTGTISFFIKWTGFQDAACCNSSGDATARQSNGQFSNHVIGLNGPDPATAVLTWQPYS
ncbi:MAG: hypothetical protein GWN87_29520, partial [Desulfuromonadales bacterium]|nr:hypothetical protein [Desulfuromonadales bacterium]